MRVVFHFGMREEVEGGQVSELGDPKFKKGSRKSAVRAIKSSCREELASVGKSNRDRNGVGKQLANYRLELEVLQVVC